MGPDNEPSIELLQRWWLLIKIPVAMSMVFMLSGIVSSFVAVSNLMCLMLPDVTIAKNGGPEWPRSDFNDLASPFKYARGASIIYVGAIGVR